MNGNNAADTQKVKDLISKVAGSINEPVKKPENKDEGTKVVKSIHVSDPLPFIAVESATYMKSGELAQNINELLSAVFVDYKECNIYYNPQVGGIGCTVRFKFMPQIEVAKADPTESLEVAISTPAQAIHETNEWANAIKRMNAVNNNGSRYAVLTDVAKEYLSDIITKVSHNGKIEWDKITNSNIEKIVDYTGHEIQIITLDVSLDLSSLLYKMMNGTESCPNFKNNKTFYYVPSFSAALGGTEFMVQITRVDSKKRKEISDMIGYRCMVPSTWNTPTRR